MQLDTVRGRVGYTIARLNKPYARDCRGPAHTRERSRVRLTASGSERGTCLADADPVPGSRLPCACERRKLDDHRPKRLWVDDDQHDISVPFKLHLDQTRLDAIGRRLDTPDARRPR